MTGSAQDAVAKASNGNRLLEFRGLPGTHDLDLAEQTLHALRTHTVGNTVLVPCYDKSLRNGRGDRANSDAWQKVITPAQIVLFEGWSLGFCPIKDTAVLDTLSSDLRAVNDALQAYEGCMEHHVGAWVIIQVDDPQWVFAWRAQAELAAIKLGKPGLTEAQVRDFVDRFMPAYAAYLPNLYGEGPVGGHGVPKLVLEINQSRMLVLNKATVEK